MDNYTEQQQPQTNESAKILPNLGCQSLRFSSPSCELGTHSWRTTCCCSPCHGTDCSTCRSVLHGPASNMFSMSIGFPNWMHPVQRMKSGIPINRSLTITITKMLKDNCNLSWASCGGPNHCTAMGTSRLKPSPIKGGGLPKHFAHALWAQLRQAVPLTTRVPRYLNLCHMFIAVFLGSVCRNSNI